MNIILFRTTALILHTFANAAVVIYLTGYDVTASWLRVMAFTLIMLVLLALFIRHVVSFINFIKSAP